MKLLQLTATFGCLQGDTLEFGPGMTLIGAPNGSGKSTWCAFLRTMLYGLDTRQRDRKGAPADKNRYRPWSGSPMEGLLVCEFQGRVLELRRTSASGVPMGDFSAVYQDTGLAVPGLTGETAGEILTGVSQEVFDRSVFFRQTGLAVSQSQELENAWSSGGGCILTEANERLRPAPPVPKGLIPSWRRRGQADPHPDRLQIGQLRPAGLRQKAHWEAGCPWKTTNSDHQPAALTRPPQSWTQRNSSYRPSWPASRPTPPDRAGPRRAGGGDSRHPGRSGQPAAAYDRLCDPHRAADPLRGGAVRSAPCAPVPPPAPGDSPPVSGPCGGGTLAAGAAVHLD
ncbi:MAG: AAA family ATPase [Evtepia gabavorous]